MAKKVVKNRKAGKNPAKKTPNRAVLRKKAVAKKKAAQKVKPKAGKKPVNKTAGMKAVKKPANTTKKSTKKTKGKPKGKPTPKRVSSPRQVATKKRSTKGKIAKKAVSKKSTKSKSLPNRARAVSHKKAPRRTPKRKRTSRPFINIKVVGVGGGGGNSITRMRRNFSVRGVEFVAINTDIQDLESCDAHQKLNIGRALTKGMGAGMNPEIGYQAAEESRPEIAEMLKGTDMVFLTAGFGGGTGTGAAPVIAEVSRELGILTVAVITKPFSFEGTSRAKIAEDGIAKIKDKVDTLLIIPNDRIFTIIDKNTSVLRAFEKIDDILKSAVQGVSEIISSSGLVNVDFADIRAVTAGAGMAVIGVGSASGADRAVKAINQAISSPLLDISIDGARSVLFGVAGGRDMRMSEIHEAAKIISDSIDPGAKIIFGAYHDRRIKAGTIKITLIATGFNGMAFRRESDSLNLFSDDAEIFGESPDIGEDSPKSDDLVDEGGEIEEKGEESEEDILDTPTFLRKRRRRK